MTSATLERLLLHSKPDPMIEMFFVDNNVVPWGPGMSNSACIPGMRTPTPVISDGYEDEFAVAFDEAEKKKDEAVGGEDMELADAKAQAPRMSLLDLPLEIRLQIYGWVHKMSPMREAQLCPWYPSPTYSAYFLQAVIPGLVVIRTPIEATKMCAVQPVTPNADAARLRGPPRQLLSPYRPLCHVPNALQRASRQVYEESRRIPFRDNEFVFVNWFSSGLAAARAFVRAMAPWQRDAMRWARLELQVKDIRVADRLADFVQLCGMWAGGLRGLRLKLELDDTSIYAGYEFRPTFGVRAEEEPEAAPAAAAAAGEQPSTKDDGEVAAVKSASSLVTLRWIDEGLRQLKALRYLEVELAELPFNNDEKLEWCENLNQRLNEGREPGFRTDVVTVEKAKEPAPGQATEMEDDKADD